MSSDVDLLEAVERQTALLALIHSDALGRARDSLRADAVTAAILDQTASGWVTAQVVKTHATKLTGASARTVERRIAELVDAGLVAARGETSSRMYRSRGLV